jgi:hypothetical protein
MEVKFIYAVDFVRSHNVFKMILLFAVLYMVIFFYNVFEAKQTYYRVETYGSLKSSKVTVVSLYFQLGQSKHSADEYKSWIKNFFLSVSSPLVIFTDKESIKDLLELRNRLNYQTTLYVTDNIWNVMGENGKQRKRNYTHNYQNKQHSLDREKHIHNPNLYALWNLKSFIADKIAQDNFYKSSAFIYTDSGAWRDHAIENWPDNNVTMSILNILNDKMLFGQLGHESNALSNANFPDFDLIEGTFFMGSKKALHDFKEGFWSIHDTRYDKGEFVGKDQVLMNLYAYKMTKSIKLDIWRRQCSANFNEWFFYQNYFASNKNYPCTSTRESLLSINRT